MMKAVKRGRSARTGRYMPPAEVKGRADAILETVTPRRRDGETARLLAEICRMLCVIHADIVSLKQQDRYHARKFRDHYNT